MERETLRKEDKTMATALVIAKMVIVRLAYVGIGAAITKFALDSKNKKKEEK